MTAPTIQISTLGNSGNRIIALTRHGRNLADKGKLGHDRLEEEFGDTLHPNTIKILTTHGWRKIWKGES